MDAHVRSADLATSLRRLGAARRWEGTGYRYAGLKYASPQKIVEGVGAQLNGGRWTPLGSFPTVYASLTPETATAEAFRHHRYYGLPDEDATPRVLVAIRFDLHHVLDLRDPAVRAALGVDLDELREEDWRAEQDKGRESLTQAIGRTAWEARFEGLLAASHADAGGNNVAAFADHLPPGRRPTVVRSDELRVFEALAVPPRTPA